MINLIGGFVAAYLALTLIQTVKRNYDIKEKIADTRAEIVDLQNERDELSYRVQYYKTDSFRDREARDKLGLQMPWESVIILPRRGDEVKEKKP